MDWLLTLQQAGLPAISASENSEGKVDATFSRGLTPAEWLLFLQLTDPSRYEKEINLADLKTAYQNMITRLEQIENSPILPFPITQQGWTQIQNAVKDEANFEKRILKALKVLVT